MQVYEYKANADSMRRVLLLGVGALAAYCILARRVPFEGWLFLSALAALGGRLLLRGMPKDACVRIDAEGVCDTRLKVGVVRWEDIKRPYIGKTQGVPFLCLELKNPDAYRARMPASERLSFMLYRLLGMKHIVIATSCLDADAETILARVRREWEYAQPAAWEGR